MIAVRMRHVNPIYSAGLLCVLIAAVHAETATTQAVYEYVEPSGDGIGKVYMGREIARVMSHHGAGWLERDEREEEERPRLLIENMNLRVDDVVADIGAGSGYFTFRLLPHLPQGKVLAVDIQPEMLELIEQRMRELGVNNVEPVLGEVDDPKLPLDSVDVVLLVDTYHEFEHPREMMEGIVASLKQEGRVVLVEYRGEDPLVPIKPLHKMTQAQAIREMKAVGLQHVETRDMLPRQHMMIFRKQTDDAARSNGS
jgi:ubiquinone/menaquinone biosynthesis C-methylase UbiE